MYDTEMWSDRIIHVLPEEGSIVEGVERDPIGAVFVSEGIGLGVCYEQLQQIQLRLFRYYLINMWGE